MKVSLRHVFGLSGVLEDGLGEAHNVGIVLRHEIFG